MLQTDLDGVFLMVAQVEELIEMIENDPNQLDRKQMEQVQGSLQRVTQTCSGMTRALLAFICLSTVGKRIEWRTVGKQTASQRRSAGTEEENVSLKQRCQIGGSWQTWLSHWRWKFGTEV
jgi:hypothetical protein